MLFFIPLLSGTIQTSFFHIHCSMPYSVISLNIISDRSEIRRLRVFRKIALPASEHKKPFCREWQKGRKEKEPHDGGLSMPIKQSLVYRNSVSCGIRMTHHSAAPQLSVYYSVVLFYLRTDLNFLMFSTSKTVTRPHFLHLDST